MILPNQNYETDLILSRNAATFRKSQEEILVEDNPSKWSERQIELDFDFHPGYYDVICARGNKAWNHPGNKFFRALVKKAAHRYSQVTSKAKRSAIVTEIVVTIRSKGNGFVKQESGGQWVEVGDPLAREKVGQMFRNSLHDQFKSSVQMKKLRRKETATKLHGALYEVMASNQGISQKMDQLRKDVIERPAITKQILSDKEVMAMFDRGNTQMLQLIKEDTSLVHRFHDVESSTYNSDEESHSIE